MMLDALRGLAVFVENNHAHLLQALLPPERLKAYRQQASKLEIQNDRIGRQCFRFNSNELPEWTQACKYFLTKLQHLVLLSVLRDQNEQMQQSY